MDLITIRDEILDELSAEQIENKIVSDLNLESKNKKYLCFMHNDKHPSLSFDSKKKRFKCFSCNGTYNLIDHYIQHYGLSFYDALVEIAKDFNLSHIMIDKPVVNRKPKEKPKEHEAAGDSVISYLGLRKISSKTIEYAGIKADGDKIVFEYLDENGVHIANKYRPAKKINKGELKMWFQKDTNQNTLFNMHRIDVGQPLIICEGEIDCLSLIEVGQKNAVSIPTGATSEEWIDSCWEWLVQFEEVTIWFDADSAGKDGARKVSARLPNRIVKVVYATKGNDINEILYRHGKEAILEELNSAKEIDIAGIAKMSQVVDFNVYEAEKIKSGIPLLDKYIWGFIMGTLDIITGYNGSGKSTLINQMCIAESLSQGFKCFVFSGELTLSNFKYWLYNTIANEQDLEKCTTYDKKEYYKVKSMAKNNITTWIDEKLFMYDKLDYGEKSLLNMMELLAKRKGVKCFIIDNLMKVELDESKNEFNAQKNFVNKLKSFAVQYDAVVHLVAHPRKPQAGQKLTKYDVAGTGDITNLADYVIGVHRTTKEEKDAYEADQAKGGTLTDPKDAAIMLFKDRPTGSPEREAKMCFDPNRKRFYITDTQLNKEYGYLLNCDDQTEINEEDFPF